MDLWESMVQPKNQCSNKEGRQVIWQRTLIHRISPMCFRLHNLESGKDDSSSEAHLLSSETSRGSYLDRSRIIHICQNIWILSRGPVPLREADSIGIGWYCFRKNCCRKYTTTKMPKIKKNADKPNIVQKTNTWPKVSKREEISKVLWRNSLDILFIRRSVLPWHQSL
jgi:hypothetical protein